MHVCVLSHFSCVWVFVRLWTITCQAPLFMWFSSQEYWGGLPSSPPEDLPDLDWTCRDWPRDLFGLLHWEVGSLPVAPLGKPHTYQMIQFLPKRKHLLVPISQSFPPSPAVPSGNQRFNSNFKMFMIHLEILLQWSSGSVYMEWGLRFLIFNSSQDPDVAASGIAFEEPGSRFLQGWKCYDFMVGDREGVSLAPFIHSKHIYLLLIMHQDLCQTLALQRWMWPNSIYQITF